jgi:hypothetical protein
MLGWSVASALARAIRVRENARTRRLATARLDHVRNARGPVKSHIADAA